LIAETLALVEVGIDFSEEDVTFLPADELRRRVEEIDSTLATLLSESTRFERLAHEPRIVLVGRPNGGKSTLINALTGQARSVVSDVAGTTRDVLSAPLALPRGLVQLVDVAGLGASTDATVTSEIESQMRTHALREVQSADHVMLLHDATDLTSPLDVGRPPDLIVISKVDLDSDERARGRHGIHTSARTGQGMTELRDALDRLAFGSAGPGSSLALNRRHVACIEDARAALARVPGRVDDGAAELIALELREALDALGRILGSVTPDDVLGRIFSSFCIGK
jgi:tRNA modification GTPase